MYQVVSFIHLFQSKFYVHFSRYRSRYCDRLRGGRPAFPSSSPGRGKIFLLHVVQTVSAAHLASYNGYRDPFSVDEAVGREADH
jgi:hypothetical protein